VTGKPRVRRKKIEKNTVSALLLNDRLSAKEIKWLFRTIAILDAVVRGKDHSIATYKAWRTQEKSQPLKYFLLRNEDQYPDLFKFVFSAKKRGAEVRLESLLSDLTRLWSAHLERSLQEGVVRELIESYSPEALVVKGHHQMKEVFETARAVVGNSNI
jgi:hypothetical protein